MGKRGVDSEVVQKSRSLGGVQEGEVEQMVTRRFSLDQAETSFAAFFEEDSAKVLFEM